jgi:alpha-L-fucosidase
LIDERTARVRPTPGQLSWQQAGTGALFHVGPSTFNGQEWSDGTDSPALFAPAGLDTDHWLACAASFGARYAVLTAKHHDGFCLWPTATTTYSGGVAVAKNTAEGGRSPPRAPLRNRFGVYLSLDRNPGLPRPRLRRLYCAQLTELLTYGDVAEIWFVGVG